ncbi:hypothetical protein [Nannocystis pusilla]|uniref:hypothetical protein n=1 Tax=Nannocystis pusilla TaxID=889268 RepID=UPI003DA68ABA
MSLVAGCERLGPQYREIVAHEVTDVAKLVVQFYAVQGRCPYDFHEMVAHGITRRVRFDPWHHPYMIICAEERVQVCSRAWDFDSRGDDICTEFTSLRPPPREPGDVAAPGSAGDRDG